MPMMAFIGVRISWLMLARNIDLAWVACSASSLALCSASAWRRASVTSIQKPFHTQAPSGWALQTLRTCTQRSVPPSCTRCSKSVPVLPAMARRTMP